MGKDIFKSIFWPVYFFVLQAIAVFVVIILDIITGKIDALTLSNMDAYTTEAIMPIFILSGLVYIITFLIVKLVSKEKFDLPKIKFKELSFCATGALSYHLCLTIIMYILYAFLTALLGQAFLLDASIDAALETQPLWISLLGTGIIVPIGEEIAFRYGLCKHIAKHNRILGIILSSVLFGIAHGNLIQAMYTCVLALGMAVIYTKTDNLWYPIIMHMTFNSLTVFSTYFGSDLIAIVVGVLGLGGFVLMFCISKDCRQLFKLPPKPVVQQPAFAGVQPNYPQQYPNPYGQYQNQYGTRPIHNPNMPYTGYSVQQPMQNGYVQHQVPSGYPQPQNGINGYPNYNQMQNQPMYNGGYGYPQPNQPNFGAQQCNPPQNQMSRGYQGNGQSPIERYVQQSNQPIAHQQMPQQNSQQTPYQYYQHPNAPKRPPQG